LLIDFRCCRAISMLPVAGSAAPLHPLFSPCRHYDDIAATPPPPL